MESRNKWRVIFSPNGTTSAVEVDGRLVPGVQEVTVGQAVLEAPRLTLTIQPRELEVASGGQVTVKSEVKDACPEARS
ncbi:MAG: hypothetical protein M1598_01975 [Actinobacteria bacterium]|nr:hypothetical protein [Actinomycetota bacterium]